MKKLSYLILSVLLVLSCGLFSACDKAEEPKITLSATNVSIYLGETENNTVVVNAKPENVDVSILDVVYDTTYIKITQSEKLPDGSFNLTIVSKVVDFGTTAPISVEIYAGDASAVFYVDLILPVTAITANPDTFVAYNGTQTSINLTKCISFEPAGTKQTGVEFALVDELSYAYIEGNYLIINADAGANFVGGEIPTIKINANSTVEGKNSIGTELSVKVIPNIQLLANSISVKLNYNGADDIALEDLDYNLSITKNSLTGEYQIAPFVVKIAIPSALGIEVDVDSQTGGGLATNILNYLTYSKSTSQDKSNLSNILDVYTFTFDIKSIAQGEGQLRFKYTYTDSTYKDEADLSATFVGVATNGDLLENIKVNVLMPITSISVSTDCTLNASDQYIIYKNYESGVYGTKFAFVAEPQGTIQTNLVLVKSADCTLVIKNSRGQLLPFEYNDATDRLECPITSGEAIYVQGGANVLDTLRCFSLASGKEGIVKEITFNVLEGGSGLGFVDNYDDVLGEDARTIYMQHDTPSEVLVYSPGTSLVDFSYNSTFVSISNTEKTGYFKITFKDLAVGEHTLKISLINGYTITATVRVIEHLTEVNVELGDNVSHLAGVGSLKVEDGDVINIALQNGYSALLNYVTNSGANVSSIGYSFFEPNIDVYDKGIENYKNVTADNYLTLIGVNDYDFVNISTHLSTQNLNLTNLLTANSTGIVIVKIDIYSQVVENNNAKEQIFETKYLYVEIYNPVKKIEASAKNISLRALNELSAGYEYLATTTIDISAISNKDLTATYDKVFVDAGTYTITPGGDGEDDIVTSKFIKRVNGKQIFEAIYDFSTKQLTINVLYVDDTIAGTIQTITLLAGDFINIKNGNTVFVSDFENYDLKTYNINITILKTVAIDEINVSNLTLESETDHTYDAINNIVTYGEKTYSTIYIDTSKGDVTYKIFTEVLPISAFNKSLTYTFNPNSGYSQAMLSFSDDGTITILSIQGGTGVITIRPQDEHSTAKTIRIPIVVADGNSWDTAYEISSLSEITDINKHYVLTNPTTYLVENTILADKTFYGGLYGKRKLDASNTYATIRLSGQPLFTALGLTAQIECLNICGDVQSRDKDIDGVVYNNGFVAYVNKGLIDNVKITTFVNQNGDYVPSTLFANNSTVSSFGGFVGTNAGTIQNCVFAGSINITKASASSTVNAFTGINNGTSTNCSVIIAKFNADIDSTRIVVDTDTTNILSTYYVNGVVDLRDGTRRTKSLFDDVTTNKKRYDDTTYVLDQNVFIRDTFISDEYSEKHSYGEKNTRIGVVFYYKALNENKQSLIAGLNTISFAELFDFANLGDDETSKINVANQLKVSAFNVDGTVCGFVNVGANSLEIKGTGTFVIRITSEFDYTIIYDITLLSIYYATEFTLSYSGAELTSEDTLKIVSNQTREIVSSLKNEVMYNGNLVELCKNDFAIAFDLIHNGIAVENSSNYITNNKLGGHTINMTFDWEEETQVYVSLDCGYGLEYNNMINKMFGLLDGEGNKPVEFKIQRKKGTTAITTNVTDGEFEPGDTFTFETTLVTDVPEDYVGSENGGIKILNQYNYDCTDLFNIDITKIDSNQDGEIDEDDYTYSIQLSLNIDAFYGTTDNNIMDYVGKRYTIVVYPLIKVGADITRYDVSTTVNFRLLPQDISTINTSLYNVTSSTVNGVNVDEKETATSVIMPTESGLFVIDMYPTYASFDYLEVVATSNTMAKLVYRLEEYDPQNIPEDETTALGWVSNYKTVVSNYNSYGKIYESIDDKNGIRIYNNIGYNKDFYDAYSDKYENRPHLNNVNNIGKYFLKIFTDSSFDTDTIFNISVKAYLNGDVLTAQSDFTLYMRMPEAPQLTIDGKTKVYKLVEEEITADVLVSDDQIGFTPYIAYNDSEAGEKVSALDGKSISKINVTSWAVSENTQVGYRRYKIAISFADGYNYKSDSTKLKLVVETIKIFNGKQIVVSSDVYIYLVDFLPEENDIEVFGVIENVFNVTSLKETELSLVKLIANKENATQTGKLLTNATEEFIEQFNNNCYFPMIEDATATDSNPTGFTFGQNIFSIGGKTKTMAKQEILASYLSYVNGNQKTALLGYYLDSNGELQLHLNQDSLNRVQFTFDAVNQKLLVRGGDTTGKVEMALEIQYKMPDDRYYTYEYRFTIVNSLYTTEDLPIEIANNADFIDIQNNDTAYDYILTKDLNLYDFTTIPNTDKIKSLDGNNYAINIWNYAKVESGTASFALFNQISEITTIKNLTINLYYLSEISVGDAVTNVQVAGLAITNNGVIYNCEVLAYKSATNTSASTVLGIKVPQDIEAQVAGLVIDNTGSITNSRVGGDSKLVTDIEYIENEEGIVNSSKISQTYKDTKLLSIKASGTIAGFVLNNSGVIASSFVKNISIKNTYNKQETRVTAGFVNTNETTGIISMCYTEGGFANNREVQSSIGGLEGTGIMSGFVYMNNGKITDSYSNLMITNTKDQVGRLGAGFVFENGEDGVVERCYSASKIISNNITQMNFAGIKDFGGYNNSGKINNSYYYIKNSADEISIESMLNTEISAVSDVTDDKMFYGFSFVSKDNIGTWVMEDNGPSLVSPNEIAHSVREKRETSNSSQSELNYVFIYSEGFALGTSENPIIIRDAEEFNSVFGGSTSTDIKENYSSTKIYGAYRIVNNIDMLELVPEEEQQTEYKVNLLSTKLVLSGEYKSTSNRPGSINGNGLTIKNLAISNSSTQSDSFGLFKSIENDASIANINITIASGGVTADHTVFVGTLAGTLQDSDAFNITISSQNEDQSVKVIGSNIVGGVFGRVIGSSYVSNITTNNISVTATYNSVSISSSGIEAEITANNNLYNRKAVGYSDLSIAGGAFGVVDIYTKEQYETSIIYAEEGLNTNILSIAVNGGVVIEGMTAGGVTGYLGEYVIAKDMAFTITNDVVDSKIIAYSYYAGGIVGYSEGYLYQAKAEHSKEWQQEIESNYHNYYTSENRDSIDRGNLEVFVSGVDYTQKAVGGLVGVVNGGKISISYSKLNVITNSAYTGGAIGYISKEYAESSIEIDGTNESRTTLNIVEVYASGDVYSSYRGGYIGGVFGYLNDADVLLSRVNAVNYWGEDAYNLFSNATAGNECFNTETKSQGDEKGRQIAPIANAVESFMEKMQEAESVTENTVYSLQSVQFVNKDEKKFNTNASKSMQGYYNYQGAVTDNGAQVDLMFKQNGWYNDDNWSRDTQESLPHIQYINSNNVYVIRSTDDFEKFALYGNDPGVLFVINGKDNGEDKLIDCTNWQISYMGLRASIVGATSEDGFKNLNIILFKTASSSSIRNLKFLNCSAPFVDKATSCKFNNLTYTDCVFSVNNDGNVGGVTNVVLGHGTSFDTITFNDGCRLYTSSAFNAGLLFATTGSSSTTVSISSVVVNNSSTNSFKVESVEYTNGSFNYGILFGSANCPVTISSVELHDSMSVSFTNMSNDFDGNGEINIGLLGGKVSELIVTLSEVKLRDYEEEGANRALKVSGPNTNIPNYAPITSLVTFNVGGLVGSATTINISADGGEEARVVAYFSPNISVKNMKAVSVLQLGTICGVAKTVSLSNNALYNLGQKYDEEDNITTYTRLEYDLAESLNAVTDTGTKGTNNIGGAVGSIQQLIKRSDGHGDPYLAYYGDIVAGDASDKNAKTFLNLGGLFGVAGDESDKKAVLQNAIFDGTMSFGKNTSQYLRLGGIVGYIQSGYSLTMYNVVSSGELILSKNNSNGEVIEFELDDNRYASGLVGFVDGVLNIGNEDPIDNTYYKTTVITTIYTRKTYENVDAFAKYKYSEDDEVSHINIKYIGDVSLAQYSSTLTLCTSSFAHNRTSSAGVINENFVENYPYSGIVADQQGTSGTTIKNMVFEAVETLSTGFGSKLNPYVMVKNGIADKADNGLSDDPTNMFHMKVEGKKITLVSGSDVVSDDDDTIYRKLYVRVENDVEWTNYQYSLQNTMIFSDGASIYSAITPFDEVDSSSAISGVTARVYIDTTSTPYDEKFKDLDCYAGFANSNAGIIYTCSVQECMNKTADVGLNNSTQFYGYFLNNRSGSNSTYTGFAGFVAVNSGYIFGSNANMYFANTNKLSASGFVVDNQKGTISYCYASGENHTKNGDLFAQENTAYYRALDSDFYIWLLGKSSPTEQEISKFWDDWEIENNTKGGVSTDKYTYDFCVWANDVIQDNCATIYGIKSEINDETNPITYEDATQQLKEIYIEQVVNGSNNKKHNQKGETMLDVYGDFECCYTIVMGKGESFSFKLCEGVFGEELANEGLSVITGGENSCNTVLFNAKYEDSSALITSDLKSYYDCNPDYNWNYPTLTGNVFKHFDYLKRDTLCVGIETINAGEKEISSYVSKNSASKSEINNAERTADTGLTYTNKDGKTITRANTQKDGETNENEYYSKVFYVQIPNLTVLKNLQKFIDGGYRIGDYKYQYSKFVFISNFNFGYWETKDDGQQDKDQDVKDIISSSGIMLNINGSNSVGGTDLVIDGFWATLSNMQIDNNENFIKKIEGSNVYLKNLYIDTVKYNQSTGLIGEIGEGVNVTNIVFRQGSLNVSSSEKITIIVTPPQKEIVEDNYFGLIAGKNSGKIYNCKMTANIQTTGDATKSYTMGGLVGINSGKIDECTFSGQVYIKESYTTNNLIDVDFGCIAGENTGDGQINKCIVQVGNMQNYYMTTGGAVIKASNENDANKNAQENGDSLLKVEEKTVVMSAQIYVATTGKAVVGGIVAKHTKGTISMCITYDMGDTPYNSGIYNYGILVGDEESQMQAYAGGIAGCVVDGNIVDSANQMHISALSVWQFTTTSQTNNKYFVDEYGNVNININEGTTYSNYKNYEGVYYPDADKEPYFRFDDLNKGLIYVYREMTSLAYAGGIAGYGLDDISNSTNYHLINYGEIKGGYRAIKPIASIEVNIEDTEKYAIAYEAGILAYEIGYGLSIGAIATPWPIDDILARVLKLGGQAAMVLAIQLAKKAVLSPTFVTTGITGNSLNYYKNKNYVSLICNSSSGYNASDIKDKIFKNLGGKDGFSIGSTWNFAIKYKHLLGNNALGAYLIPGVFSSVESAFKDSVKITFETKVNESVSYTDQVKKRETSDSYLQLDSLSLGSNVFTDYCYDGICPTLQLDDSTALIYSEYEYYEEGSKTPNSGNPENNRLSYNKIGDKAHYEQSPLQKDWGETNWGFDPDTERYVPKTDLPNMVDPTNKDEVEKCEQEGVVAKFNVYKESDWKDIVFTINTEANKDLSDLGDETYAQRYHYAYTNAEITIAFKNNIKILFVDNNVLNDFGGKIISNSQYSFQNLILTNKGTENAGLIRKSEGATLKNINIAGSLDTSRMEEVTTSGGMDGDSNLGVLIGEVYGTRDVVLDNIYVSLSTIELKDNTLNNTNNFGLIGNINLEGEESKVSVKNINYNSNVSSITLNMTPGISTTNNGFGLVVGKLTKGSLLIDESEFNSDIEIASNYNNVGGLIGSTYAGTTVVIGESLSDSITANITVKALSMANTSVGGIIGYNAGSVEINGLTIGVDKTLLVSADVSAFEYFASAGGIIGYNDSENIEIFAVTLGKSMTIVTSFDDVGYVFAGYCMIELDGIEMAFPCKYNTGVGQFAGNMNESQQEALGLTPQNIITKYIASDIPGDSVDSSWLSHFDNYITGASHISWSDLRTTLNSIEVKTSNDFLNNITTGNSLSTDYTVKNYEQNSSNSVDSYDSAKGKYKIDYKIAFNDKINISTSSQTDDMYEWLLQVDYYRKTTEIGTDKTVSTARMSDGRQYAELSYKFIIRLINVNAKLDDNNIYALQIIQLNDYSVKTTTETITVTTKSIDESSDKSETTSTQAEVFVDAYTVIDDFVPKVVYSKRLSFNDTASGSSVISLDHLLDLKFESIYSKTKYPTSILEGNTSISVSSEHVKTKINPTTMLINIEKREGQWNFSIKESYKVEIDSNQSSITSSHSGNENDEDGTHTEKSDSSSNVGTYTREILSKSIKNDIVATSDFEVNNAPNYEFSAVVTKEKYDAAVNAGYSIKLNANGDPNVAQKPSDSKTLIYTDSFTLDGGISVGYEEPTYTYNDKEYQSINVFKYVLDGKNYVIVSCVDSAYSIIDYVYLVDGNEFRSCGTISYMLQIRNTEANASMTLDALYSSAMANRYSSFFPVIDKSSTIITNIKDDITDPASRTISSITYKYNYYKAQAIIETYDFYYKTTIINTGMICDVKLTPTSLQYVDNGREDSTRKSQSSNIQYYNQDSYFSSLIVTKEVTIDEMYKAENYTSAQDSIYRNNVVRFDARTTLTNGADSLLNERFDSDWASDIRYYYAYDGRIIGFVTMKDNLYVDTSGDRIEEFVWKTYFDNAIHNNVASTRWVEKAQATEVVDDEGKVTESNCYFIMFDRLNTNVELKVNTSD